jgi:hypothetical protein
MGRGEKTGPNQQVAKHTNSFGDETPVLANSTLPHAAAGGLVEDYD